MYCYGENPLPVQVLHDVLRRRESFVLIRRESFVLMRKESFVLMDFSLAFYVGLRVCTSRQIVLSVKNISVLA